MSASWDPEGNPAIQSMLLHFEQRLIEDMIGTFASHHAILTYQGDTWQCLDVRRREATA